MEGENKRSSFFTYLFTIILSKNRHRNVKKLLLKYSSPNCLKLQISHKCTSINIAYVHPLTCFSQGVIADQLVKIIFSINTNSDEIKSIERVIKIKYSSHIQPGQLVMSREDCYNIFQSTNECSTRITTFLPLFKFRSGKIEKAESIKIYRIKHPDQSNESYLTKESIESIIKEENIVYKNDYVRIVDTNNFTSNIVYHYYKIESSISPCIIDDSTSIYESTPSSSYIPFSKFYLKAPISDSMKSSIHKMVNVYKAFKRLESGTLVILVTGSSGSGRRLMSRLFASQTHRVMMEVDAYQLYSENPANSESKISQTFEKAQEFKNCVLYIRNADVIAYDPFNGVDRRLIKFIEMKLKEFSKMTIILSCTTDRLSQMSSSVRDLALYKFSVDYLDEDDRFKWLNHFIKDNQLCLKICKKTNGFTLAELEKLLMNANYFQLKNKKDEDDDYFMHFEKAIDIRNSNFADAIGAPKIPNVKWSDVGGLEETKQTVIESIRTNLYGTRALKRSGIILYGQPGCGKTLIAKAVATEFNIAFLSVKGPELLNKYVGQSEENLRKVFERAKQSSPCVIFFDEIDSLAPNRGKNGDSGGVIDRIVSQLLAELDKLHNSPRTKVFVMGATNRPDLLDTSLMTPGRFDKMVEVKPGTDVDSKTKILEAISRKMNLAEDVDLRQIAAECDNDMSGAQLFSIISNAAMDAIVEKISEIPAVPTIDASNQVVQVSQKHLIKSIQKFKNTQF